MKTKEIVLDENLVLILDRQISDLEYSEAQRDWSMYHMYAQIIRNDFKLEGMDMYRALIKYIGINATKKYISAGIVIAIRGRIADSTQRLLTILNIVNHFTQNLN